MELTWLDRDHLDRRDVDGIVSVWNAARAVDTPQLPPFSVAGTAAKLRHGFDGHPPETAVVRDRYRRVIGMLQVELPHWDNTHLGVVEVCVDPEHRRSGLGRELFEAGVRRVREHGRRLLLCRCYDVPGAVAFAKAMSLEPAHEEVLRRQDLTRLDWHHLDREYQRAARLAADYELVRMPGPVPDDLLDDVAAMTAAINDAPTGSLDIEDEVFSGERIRAFEAAARARGGRDYRVVARHLGTGALAGHTMVEVAADSPWDGGQLDTSVLPAHRGHRLGLLLKLDMLYWLREAEPQLRSILTGNAADNSHMILVNEALGYQVVTRTLTWQRHLAPS